MVGVADREIEPDHVVGERHGRVERGRAGVVAELRVDPGDACGARLLDRDLGRALHHEMAHAVVAVHKRGGGLLAHHADVRPDVEAAGLDAAGILRQPADAVPVRSLQIGLRHQGRDRNGVSLGQAEPRHRLRNEGLQPVEGHGHQDASLAAGERLEGDDGVGVLDAGNHLDLLVDEMADVGVVVDVELDQQIVIAGGGIGSRRARARGVSVRAWASCRCRRS